MCRIGEIRALLLNLSQEMATCVDMDLVAGQGMRYATNMRPGCHTAYALPSRQPYVCLIHRPAHSGNTDECSDSHLPAGLRRLAVSKVIQRDNGGR